MAGKFARGQAAIDFMTSYGIALLVIAIALYVIFQLGIFNYSVAPQYCYSTSALACASYAINSNGELTLLISQSSGGALVINGAACSTAQNAIDTGPRYGNTYVVPPPNPNFYPSSETKGGITVYPGSTVQIQLYCWGAGGPSKSQVGQLFNGYVWLNYTYSGLPSNSYTVQQALSLSVRYT
jgi:hypothetical protein